MLRRFLEFLLLIVGIGAGFFVSSKVDLLDTVVKEYDSNKAEDFFSENTNFNITESNLVLVNGYYDDFEIDLKYATTDNITKEILYDNDLMYLQKKTLDKLIQVNEELKLDGYRLKIWDAYRPLSVQKKLWAVCPNSNYIANPFSTGSNHNRGAAVDVTLIDLNGNELKMPTGFDEFSSKCRRGYPWSKDIVKKVDVLTEAMEKYGFSKIQSEWWHFDDVDAKNYPIMDYTFRELLKK